MKKFHNFRKLGTYLIQKQDSQLGKLLDTYLGLGKCKHCGFKHPSIDKYCKQCLELSSQHEIILYNINPGEYKIRKRSNHVIQINRN
jgi:predicted amidophosphoribosyltransferase